ncbi:MAG: rhomboid family intramembrane serine protease [Candidatus Binatia bacterium]
MGEDAFFRFLQKLGINTTRLRWRWVSWQNRWAGRKESVKLARQHTTYQHKICNECGGLMDGAEKTCPRCGAKAPSWTGQFIQRIFGLVFPQWGVFSSLLVMANLAMVLIGIGQFGIGNLTSPSSESLLRWGALFPPYFYLGDYWRLITYGYLHIGLLHILFNLIVLIQVGPYLEREIGGARFFSAYTLSLIGGGIADLIFRKGIFLVAGASGALFGMIGFGIAYNHFLGGPTAQARRNFFLHWALYGFLFGIFVGADNVAHAGGLITGALLGLWMEKEGMRRKAWTAFWNVVCAISIIVTVLSFVGMVFEIQLPRFIPMPQF